MDRAIRRRRPEHTNELVVANRHLGVVLEQLEALHGLGVLARSPEVAQSDDRLGLCLVPLEFPPDPVATEDLGTAGAAAAGVDEVLQMVRENCSYRYRGWVPTIGKNRVVSGFGGEGTLGGGGVLVGGGGVLVGGGGGLPSVPPAGPPRVRGSRGEHARLAILDTPIYRDSPQLDGVDYVGRPPREPATQPVDAGHALFVLGLMRRRAPGAHIDVRPTLDQFAAATAWQVARHMADLSEEQNAVDIVNLSLGCYTLDNQPPLLLQRAVQLLAPTTLIVAAAGNHREPRRPRPFWPAALDGVVAVGARDQRGRLSGFSPHAPWVDVTAPGEDLVSDYLDGRVELKAATDEQPARIEEFPGFAQWRGTSFAAAIVAGEVGAHITATRPARRALRHILANRQDASSVRPYTYS